MEAGQGEGAGRSGHPRATPPEVLVVDDYPPNLTALRALLTPIAPVTSVDSGVRALQELERRDYAVVVMDIQMPRMSGLDLARRIRAGGRNQQVPIIFLTAMDSDTDQILDGYAAGCVDYLRRPFIPAILQSKVSIFVELHGYREVAKREAAERAQLEAQRAAAEQASREKDQFLAVLSHELRTPLTSILLWSDMLLHRTLPAETLRRGLETIDLCARYEAHIVERVLEMSRLVTGTLSLELAPVDLNEVLAEAAEDVLRLAAERQVQVSISQDRVRWRADGDRLRLRQVVYNLLENAVNFTPAGGRVDVTIEDSGADVRLRVQDTGVGFSKELGPKLFARFKPRQTSSTRVGGGLGLGLALSRELIALHGGNVTAESEGPDRGATFTVTLPHERPMPAEPGVARSETPRARA